MLLSALKFREQKIRLWLFLILLKESGILPRSSHPEYENGSQREANFLGFAVQVNKISIKKHHWLIGDVLILLLTGCLCQNLVYTVRVFFIIALTQRLHCNAYFLIKLMLALMLTLNIFYRFANNTNNQSMHYLHSFMYLHFNDEYHSSHVQ